MTENKAMGAKQEVLIPPVDRKQKIKNFLLENFPVLGLIIIVIFFGIVTKGSLFSSYNLRSIANQMFLYILGGFGCLFLFAQGGIDLSMAANIGLAAILGVQVMQVNVALGTIVTILIGTVVGERSWA